LVFKITSDQTNLTVGQTTTVHVWGWADDPLAIGTNGLVDWGLSLVVNTGGIVEITKDLNTNGDITILAPAPLSTYAPNWAYSSVNSGKSGQVSGVNALRNPDTESTTGVGGYTELFNFKVEAIGEGVVTYGMTNMLGDLVDYTPYDSGSGTAVFNTAASSNILTVVPEPSSLVILSGLWVAGFLTRRKK
jgi:hypothetical protein